MKRYIKRSLESVLEQAIDEFPVIVLTGPQAGKHGHLGPTLDLEDADGLGPADHIERGRIVLGNRRHGELDASMAL